MKNNEILNEALGKIDDKMIAAAYERQAEKKSLSQLIGKITAVAAVAAFAAFAILFPIMAKRTPAPVSSETSYTAEQPYDQRCNYMTVIKDYIFRRDEDGNIIRYNVHTGETTFVCTDPLCDKNGRGCPGAESFAFIGNTLYYINPNENGGSDLWALYEDRAVPRLLYTFDGDMSIIYSYENTLLLRSVELITRGTTERYYYRYIVNANILEQLDGRNISNGFLIKKIMNGRIIWVNALEEGHPYYDTDLDGKDVKKHEFGHYYGNVYREALEVGEDGVEHCNLYVTLAGETEEKLLIADLGLPLFAEDKIVYTKIVPKEERRVAYVEESGRKETDPYGGDVYIMDPDGGNDHLLFHTDERIMEMGDNLNDRVYVSGDIIGILAEHYVPGRGILGKLITANIKTGEFAVGKTYDEITDTTKENPYTPISLHGVGEVRKASFIIGSKGEDTTDNNGASVSSGLDMSTIYGSDELRRYFPSLLPESYLVFGVTTTTEDGGISRVTLKLLDDTDGSYRDGMSEAEVFSLANTHDSMSVELFIKNDANARFLEGYTERWDVTDTLSARGIEAKYNDLSKAINCLVDFGDVIMYYNVQERGVHGATVDSDALYRIITSTPAINVVE